MWAQSVRARSKARWERLWTLEDFSWDGLARKPLAADADRVRTLQDYWRDEEQRLIRGPGGSFFTRFHLPLRWSNGASTGKADWIGTERDEFVQRIEELCAAAESTRADYEHKPAGVDLRAQLSGVIVPAWATSVLSERVPRMKADFLYCGGPLNWRDTECDTALDFERAWIDGQVTMQGASFRERLNFRGATFAERAWFRGANFDRDVSFEETFFLGSVSLTSARFKTAVSFARARFGRVAEFEEVILPRNRSFDEVKFTAVTDASRLAMGVGLGLLLVSAALALSTSFAAPEYRLLLWSAAGVTAASMLGWSLRGGCVLLDDKTLERQSRAFRTLARLSADMDDNRSANLFHSLHMRAWRMRPRTDPAERALSATYDLVSNAGRSLVRPVLALATFSVGFALLYASLDPAALGAFREGLELSGNAVFRPFAIWDESGHACDLTARLLAQAEASDGCSPIADRSPWTSLLVRLLSSAQSVLSIMLVFVLGLAIRRRFDIG